MTHVVFHLLPSPIRHQKEMFLDLRVLRITRFWLDCDQWKYEKCVNVLSVSHLVGHTFCWLLLCLCLRHGCDLIVVVMQLWLCLGCICELVWDLRCVHHVYLCSCVLGICHLYCVLEIYDLRCVYVCLRFATWCVLAICKWFCAMCLCDSDL